MAALVNDRSQQWTQYIEWCWPCPLQLMLVPKIIYYKHKQCRQLGNCNICARQNISFMNEMKRFAIWPRLSSWVPKILLILPPNFVKGVSQWQLILLATKIGRLTEPLVYYHKITSLWTELSSQRPLFEKKPKSEERAAKTWNRNYPVANDIAWFDTRVWLG